jgi:hypothetical protein
MQPMPRISETWEQLKCPSVSWPNRPEVSLVERDDKISAQSLGERDDRCIGSAAAMRTI